MNKSDIEAMREYLRITSADDFYKRLFDRIVKQPKITIKQDENGWTADREGLPGSPVVGRGPSWKLALGDLVLNDPDAFGIEHNANGVVGIKVINKDGSPHKFRDIMEKR